jgi:hypothetical protein
VSSVIDLVCDRDWRSFARVSYERHCSHSKIPVDIFRSLSFTHSRFTVSPRWAWHDTTHTERYRSQNTPFLPLGSLLLSIRKSSQRSQITYPIEDSGAVRACIVFHAGLQGRVATNAKPVIVRWLPFETCAIWGGQLVSTDAYFFRLRHRVLQGITHLSSRSHFYDLLGWTNGQLWI